MTKTLIKLVVCKGLPASGKSTYSKKWAEADPTKRIRVCRDDIRRMLGPYWVPQREDLVTNIEDAIIIEGLTQNYSVVVDATNLRGTQRFENMLYNSPESMWFDDVLLTVKDFTDVPIETCIERDKNRDKSVGEEVILKMAKKYNL